MKGKVIGVTGSVGKTGTKDMLRTGLALAGKVYATKGNLNNHFGVPLTLANMPRDTDVAIIEMGMNHAGEIRALTQQARPDIALVTTVAPAHLEFFDSVADIARAKAEIFEGLAPGGWALLPADSEYLPILHEAGEKHAGHILTCGEAAGADLRLTGSQGNAAAAQWGDMQLQYRLPAPGRHVARNSLFTLAAGRILGLELTQVAATLEQAVISGGRGERIRLQTPQGNVTLIDDSYNANPSSMGAALQVLGEEAGRKLAVLGDMLELGPQSSQLHAGLAPAIAEAGIDKVLTVGQEMQALQQVLPAAIAAGHAHVPEAALPLLEALWQAGDTLLLKGSHGSGVHLLALLLKQRYATKAEAA